MDSHERIAVVGAGVFGVGTALALARAGYQHVEVLERGHVGSGATAYAAGILSLQTWNDDDAALILRTRDLLVDLVEWGRAAGEPAAHGLWNRVGGVTIAPPRFAGKLAQMHARMRRMGQEADLLDAREAARRFPCLVFAPDETALDGLGDGYVASTDLVLLVRRRLRDLGVRVREGTPVAAVRHERGRVTGVALAGGGPERADRVVVAGGAWTRGLLAASGVTLPAISYRTQLASLAFPDARGVPVVHDTRLGFYARPESSTSVLAGDGTQLRSFDPDAFDRGADPTFVEATAARVLERVRDGALARYRTGWAGLCVGTPDRRPLAGPVPGIEGLYALTGDNGFGVMRGLALGERVACAVAGTPDPGLAALRLDRFAGIDPDAFALGEGFSFGD